MQKIKNNETFHCLERFSYFNFCALYFDAQFLTKGCSFYSEYPAGNLLKNCPGFLFHREMSLRVLLNYTNCALL